MADTEIKNKIPEGWQNAFLSDDSNFRIVGSRVNYWTGLKPYLSTKSVQGTVIAEIEDYISFNSRPSRANMQPEAGVIAFAKMGDTFKVLFNDENIAKNYILSTGFCLIKPKIDPKYFFHFIASDKFQNNKELYCEGSTQKAISQKDYDKLEILFPLNPKEQQKIAEVLTMVDEAIKKTDAIIEKKVRIKQGLMQDLFSYGIDERGNIRSEKTHKFKTVKIGNEEMRIPEEWEYKKFRDISVVRQGLQIAISERKHSPGLNRYQYITIQFLNDRGSFNDFVENPTKSVICKKDDILVVRTGNMGMVVTDEDGVFHNNFFLVDFDRKKLIKDWLVYYLRRSEIQNIFQIFAGTTTIPDLKHDNYYDTPCIFPSEINEQVHIVSILKSINNTIDQEIIYKQKLLSLKRGITEDLLTGTVRVNSLITK